ncbi:hypothetical protein CF166_07935 [Amycolatopsis sp. KNN50.9b]|nr:hypothetical protein CF166_07935 [Amycolatopsis sp. KNN50.9b]
MIREAGSGRLVDTIDRYHDRNALLAASSLVWIEVARARRARSDLDFAEVTDDVEAALSGVAARHNGLRAVAPS